MSTLNVSNLSKSYVIEGRSHTVLDKLSLEVDCSRITVILGKSGCGKTTLLRLLAGLEKYDYGTIKLPDIKIGMMFQEARLMPWLTCAENISFGQRLSESEINRLLQTVGLEGFGNAYPKQLSGGMQQRASLARTLAQHSQLILMDEPFAALDYFTRIQMQQEILRIKQATGTGIMFVTHNIDEALTIADTILVMKNGSVEAKICLPAVVDRDILQEPYLSYKKTILHSLLPKNI